MGTKDSEHRGKKCTRERMCVIVSFSLYYSGLVRAYLAYSIPGSPSLCLGWGRTYGPFYLFCWGFILYEYWTGMEAGVGKPGAANKYAVMAVRGTLNIANITTTTVRSDQ